MAPAKAVQSDDPRYVLACAGWAERRLLVGNCGSLLLDPEIISRGNFWKLAGDSQT
jgi:hypothetical protein